MSYLQNLPMTPSHLHGNLAAYRVNMHLTFHCLMTRSNVRFLANLYKKKSRMYNPIIKSRTYFMSQAFFGILGQRPSRSFLDCTRLGNLQGLGIDITLAGRAAQELCTIEEMH
uniref:Uncharacterized protein n=1 Tax=Setaria viridis TaxID=4556 RepID=A0A4U6TIA2_SETVI|nr:hypothetical protein SEVIR_8G100300v2 [Setaria viridis]